MVSDLDSGHLGFVPGRLLKILVVVVTTHYPGGRRSVVVATTDSARGGDRDREVIIGLMADYRTRLEPPITSNYIGNCVVTQVSFLKAEDLMVEKGVEIAAEKLSEAIKGLENKGAVEALEKLFCLFGKAEGGIQILGTAGSNRFGVYETDFGWGRPKKVEIVSIDRTGSVSLAESRRGHGGVEVGLVLDKNEMDAFASFFDP